MELKNGVILIQQRCISHDLAVHTVKMCLVKSEVIPNDDASTRGLNKRCKARSDEFLWKFLSQHHITVFILSVSTQEYGVRNILIS